MQKKVMVFGTFDILHKGHINFFTQAKKYGDILIVIVARDKNVIKIKKKPHYNEKTRLSHVKKYADAYLGYINDQYKIIKKIKPDIICLGYDQAADLKELKKLRIKIKRLKPYKKYIYKSSLIKKSLGN